jgi:hypothetical protein
MQRIQWSETIEEKLNEETKVVPMPENNAPLDPKYADIADQLYVEFAHYCTPYGVWESLRDIEPTKPIKVRSAVIEVMQTQSFYEPVMMALKDTNHTHALFDDLIGAFDRMFITFQCKVDGVYNFAATGELCYEVKVTESCLAITATTWYDTEPLKTVSNDVELKHFVENDLTELRGKNFMYEVKLYLVRTCNFSGYNSPFTRGNLTVSVTLNGAKLTFHVTRGLEPVATFTCACLDRVKFHSHCFE